MSDLNSIDIIDLLRQREVEFVRVWRCEKEIKALLGLDSFPFPAPPDLPSRHKPVKMNARQKAQNKPNAKEEKRSLFDVRKLDGEHENAYRITFINKGLQESSFQRERELVRQLINMKTTDFVPVSVEAVEFNGINDWKTVESLWVNRESVKDCEVENDNNSEKEK